MDCFHLVGNYGVDFHAGPKAQRDVTSILDGLAWRPFFVRRCAFGGAVGRLLNRLDWLVRVRWLRWKLPSECVLFMQYPSSGWSKSPSLRLLDEQLKAKRHIKLIVLIHDVASLRWGTEPFESRMLSREEFDLMQLADMLVVHNESMRAALVKRGIRADKMCCLKLFDYLSPCEQSRDRMLSPSVAIAGNLNPEKAGYLTGLAKIKDVTWNLYGVEYCPERIQGDNVIYKGCFSPEELPANLEGAFGLVWDGLSVETCSGDFGNYLRINNPHKLSLYLRAGLPVIVWGESAVSQFVREKGVGIVVDSLKEISERIESIDAAQYESMSLAARDVGMQLARGEFTKRAVTNALEQL